MAIAEQAHTRIFGCKAKAPLHYAVCGQLLSPAGFLHHRRNFAYHVLILVTEGTLFIHANNAAHKVGAGQYIFLRAGEEHFGERPSEGKLSYLWVHFQADAPMEELRGKAVSEQAPASLQAPALLQAPAPPQATIAGLAGVPTHVAEEAYMYQFPETGHLSDMGRAAQLFRQLMDVSFEEGAYTQNMSDYAMSLLLMEISRGYAQPAGARDKLPEAVISAREWIKNHYYHPFEVSELAEILGYRADYLSSLFKRQMGVSIVRYANQIRIRTARTLLSNYDVTIKEAAYSCGFSDEKYFMKVFKQMAGITPAQYRSSFNRRNVN